MFYMIMYFMLLFFGGMYVFCFKREHLLLMLLGLEYMVVGLYYNIHLFLSLYGYGYSFLIIFLVCSVCEGVLGLSILVKMIRVEGNDYVFGPLLFLC
uniref:NADH-ubiquinone oxidoreductase chain 4L n=1 Tax=Zhengitettix curvispinus TaxID=2793214 RepID=A0A7U3QC65_9ORTH|nr:NADH dehydrogenase subunit 4L [Zhengitettix curvispinus]